MAAELGFPAMHASSLLSPQTPLLLHALVGGATYSKGGPYIFSESSWEMSSQTCPEAYQSVDFSSYQVDGQE